MGNKQKKPDLTDIAMDLKMQSRMLEKQSQKLEASEKMECKKIIDVSYPLLYQLGIKQKLDGKREGLCGKCYKKS